MKRKTALSARAKALRNPGSLVNRRRADKLWAQVVRQRWGSKCAVCDESSGVLHAHHLISRRMLHLRHCPENGILLCYQHHTGDRGLSAHEAPYAFEGWLAMDHPAVHDWLVDHIHDSEPVMKHDYAARAKALAVLLEAEHG